MQNFTRNSYNIDEELQQEVLRIMATKPTQDQTKASNKEYVDRNRKVGKRQGIAQKPLDEPIPTLEKAQCEKVIHGENNSLIILGRDRPNNVYSGTGARGATGASRIDLIAGLASAYRHKDGSYGQPNEGVVVNPNFAMDAARVYITQKGHIDRYMGLAEVPRQSPANRSAVGIKADAVRIHSRNDVKIVTGKARFAGTGKAGERLSTGGKNELVGTISLIAGNYTGKEDRSVLDILRPFGRTSDSRETLQPLPKGDNLVECLEDIVTSIQRLSSLVGSNTAMIQKMDIDILKHTHPVAVSPVPPHPPIALPPVPAPGVNVPGYKASPLVQSGCIKSIKSRQSFNKNLGLIKFNYFNKNFGSDYINSKNVFTT